MKKSNLSVLYLGSSGAGVKFTEFMIEELKENWEDIGVISRSFIKIPKGSINHLIIKVPGSRILAGLGVGRRVALRQILDFVRENKTKVLIIPMAHPWDLSFQEILQEEQIKIIRIIHDAQRHPGDIWPRKSHINKMLRSDYLITLSEYVKFEILRRHVGFVLSTVHPRLQYQLSESTSPYIEVSEKYDLIIGRQRRYQNARRVIKWWRSIPFQVTEGRILVIAGRTNIWLRMRHRDSRIRFIRGWLSESEFSNLVRGANRIFCLYEEASQSGIVSIAQQFSIPILVTRVGGLPEQILRFGGGVIVDKENPLNWTDGYINLNNGIGKDPVSNDPNRIFMKDVSDVLGFVHELS
jgi:hypothetical protein